MTTNAASFPWRSLDSVRRADVGLLAKMRRAADRIVDTESSMRALREMLTCEVSVQRRRVTSTPPRVDDAAIGVLVAPGERMDRHHAFAIVLEQALAGVLAARVLRRPAPRIVDGARAAPSLAGAVAALLVAAARRNAQAPLRVITAGTAHSVLAEIVAYDAMPIGVTFTVLVDHDAYLAYAFAPRSALESLRETDLGATSLAAALGLAPLTVPLVGAVLTMTVDELAALSPGDALFPVDREHMWLSPETSDVGFGVTVAEGGQLVLRDGPHPLLEEKTVDKNALVQAIGDTPLVVRVEIGLAEMTAREWASLGSGDVIALGKRIGEYVVLRVGGVEVARGELVDLEGETGVRIVSRSGDTVA